MVVNRIEVSKVAALSDSQIRRDVEAALLVNPAKDSYKITTTAQNGVATLTGTVDTWNERHAATEDAYQGGATLVKNDLVVDYDF